MFDDNGICGYRRKVAGADTEFPFSVTRKTLGTITVNNDGAKSDNRRIATFDAKSIPNYKKLSIDNFVVVPYIWINGYTTDQSMLARARVEQGSYNASTGILTVPYYLQLYSQNATATYTHWDAKLTCYAFY